MDSEELELESESDEEDDDDDEDEEEEDEEEEDDEELRLALAGATSAGTAVAAAVTSVAASVTSAVAAGDALGPSVAAVGPGDNRAPSALGEASVTPMGAGDAAVTPGEALATWAAGDVWAAAEGALGGWERLPHAGGSPWGRTSVLRGAAAVTTRRAAMVAMVAMATAVTRSSAQRPLPQCRQRGRGAARGKVRPTAPR